MMFSNIKNRSFKSPTAILVKKALFKKALKLSLVAICITSSQTLVHASETSSSLDLNKRFTTPEEVVVNQPIHSVLNRLSEELGDKISYFNDVVLELNEHSELGLNDKYVLSQFASEKEQRNWLKQTSEVLDDYFDKALIEDAQAAMTLHNTSLMDTILKLQKDQIAVALDAELSGNYKTQYSGIWVDTVNDEININLVDPEEANLSSHSQLNLHKYEVSLAEQERITQAITQIDSLDSPEKGFLIFDPIHKKVLINVQKSNLALAKADFRQAVEVHKNQLSGVEEITDMPARDSLNILGKYESRVEFVGVDLGAIQPYSNIIGGVGTFTPGGFRTCSGNFNFVGTKGSELWSTAGHCIQGAGNDWIRIHTASNPLVRGVHNELNTVLPLNGWDFASFEPGKIYGKYVPEFKFAHGLSRREVKGIISNPLIGQTVCKFGFTTARKCGVIVGKVTALLPYTINSILVSNFNPEGPSAFAQPGDSGGVVYSGHSGVGMVAAGGPAYAALGPTFFTAHPHLRHNSIVVSAHLTSSQIKHILNDSKFRPGGGFHGPTDQPFFLMTTKNAPTNCKDYGLSIIQVRADSITCGLPIPSAQQNPTGSANNSGVGRPRLTSGVAGAGGGRLNGAVFGAGISSGGTTYGGASRSSGGNHSNGTGFPKATVNNRNGDNCNVRWCQHVRPVPRYGLAGLEHGFGWENTFNQTVSCAALNNMDTIELARHDRVQQRNGNTLINLVPNHHWVLDPTNIPNDLKCTTMREYFAY